MLLCLSAANAEARPSYFVTVHSGSSVSRTAAMQDFKPCVHIAEVYSRKMILWMVLIGTPQSITYRYVIREQLQNLILWTTKVLTESTMENARFVCVCACVCVPACACTFILCTYVHTCMYVTKMFILSNTACFADSANFNYFFINLVPECIFS